MRKNIILTYEILYLNKYNFFLNSIRKNDILINSVNLRIWYQKLD